MHALYQRPDTDVITNIVLLGGDHPLALPIIHELEQQGYIIIASVESPEYVQELERKCNGFVRALALDPSDVSIHTPKSCIYIAYVCFPTSQIRFLSSCARLPQPCRADSPSMHLATLMPHRPPNPIYTRSSLFFLSRTLRHLLRRLLHHWNTFRCRTRTSHTCNARTSRRCRLFNPSSHFCAPRQLAYVTRPRGAS